MISSGRFKTPLIGLFLLLVPAVGSAQTRTPWQMHDGLEVTSGNPLGLIPFSCSPSVHGDVCEYDVAVVPPALDAAWTNAPDGDIIGFSIFPSRVCQAPNTCLAYGDFTYFQAFVDIPLNVAITQFTINFNGMDDGSRVTIYNSAFPDGLVIAGSYVFLGGSGTTDLSAAVISGEVNRVVVTQVDDCCIENNLHSAVVVLNGQVVSSGCASNAECDDGNACTDDVCNADGSCGYGEHLCDDGNACTSDSCDPAGGCVNLAFSCDDGNDCTSDVCDPAGGCSHENQCPDCGAAAPSIDTIWPPDNSYVGIDVNGVVDPQGGAISIAISSMFSDEPAFEGEDKTICPDAKGIGYRSAWIRAERYALTPSDGRVYHIGYTATDPDGYKCTGEVTVCVPYMWYGTCGYCTDGGALYNMLQCY